MVVTLALAGLGRLKALRAPAHGRRDSTAGFDYATITEDWDTPANIEQREMSYVRHELVRRSVGQGRLLDVACGTAYGLAFTSPDTEMTVGVDVNWENLRSARRHLPNGLFVQATAAALPFQEGSFDVVSCLEALYYFPDQSEALRNMRHVLRPDGQLVLTMPNPQRPGFNSSAGASSYLSATRLAQTLHECGFKPSVFGAFHWKEEEPLRRLLEAVRILAVKAGVIPGSLAGRAVLKRFAFRNMRPVAHFDRTVDLGEALIPIDPPDFASTCKVILVVAAATDA